MERADGLAKPIGIILPSLAAGGAERVMINYANYLVSSGFKVTIIVLKNDFSLEGLIDNRVAQVRLECSSYPSSIMVLKKVLDKNDYGSIYVTMFHINVMAIISMALSSSNIPLIIREANTLSTELSNMKFWKRLVYGVLVPICYPRADHIIAVSAGVSNDLVKSFRISPNLVSVILNPVQAASTKREAYPKVKSNVVAVGRLEKQKDFGTLLRAIQIVRKECDVDLFILGEGSLGVELSLLANELGITEHVSFLGRVDNVYDFLSTADVFVLSSIYEGCPNSLLEALACGANVVATDCPSGPREILENGKFGHLVAIESPGEMAKAIISSIREPITSADLINHSRNFSPAAQYKKYRDLLEVR
jgi:glycosyltransferase involved in cell wall biosynthesis